MDLENSSDAGAIGLYGPRFTAAADFAEYCMDHQVRRRKGGLAIEACGLFLAVPTTWHSLADSSTGSGGWRAHRSWLGLENRAVDGGEFIMNTHGLSEFVQDLFSIRCNSARAACLKYGLNDWHDCVLALGGDIDSAEGVLERSGYLPYLEELRNDSEKIVSWDGDSRSADRDSALEYLMLTGPQIVHGTGHSHIDGGSGSGRRGGLEPSPQDLLSCRAVDVWRDAIRYSPTALQVWDSKAGAFVEDSGLSSLESDMGSGNYICAVSRAGNFLGMSQFDARGLRKEWWPSE